MRKSGEFDVFSQAETHKVERVEFGVMDPGEIRAASVAQIVSENTYDQVTGLPK